MKNVTVLKNFKYVLNEPHSYYNKIFIDGLLYCIDDIMNITIKNPDTDIYGVDHKWYKTSLKPQTIEYLKKFYPEILFTI